MFVVQYEARSGPRPALRPVRHEDAVSLNTHDMPPFAAYWKGLDIADRGELGLIRRRDLAREYRLRERLRGALLQFLRRRGALDGNGTEPESVVSGLLKHLGASPARWLVVNLEDLWLETAPQNTPGTSTERVNWRCKLRLSLGQLREPQAWSGTLSALRQLRP